MNVSLRHWVQNVSGVHGFFPWEYFGWDLKLTSRPSSADVNNVMCSTSAHFHGMVLK
jgi:hypothetical protein